MMDARMRQDLDNYITGHYGEDQFKGEDDEVDPFDYGDDYPETAHGDYLVFRSEVYAYDPAEDGPECEIITRILAAHPDYRPREERREMKADRFGRIFAGRVG